MRVRILRTLQALCVLAAIAFAVPSSASAHHVDAAASSASCVLVDGTPTVTVTIEFKAFEQSNMPVTGTIALDGAVVKSYTDLSWSGDDHSLVYTQSTIAGAHVLRAEFTWPGKTKDLNGTVEKSVECPAAPTQPPTGGGGTTPTGGTTPAGTTPVVAPTPSSDTSGGGVLPETVVSGRARLLGPSGCVNQAFRARVRGRQIVAVTFLVDGKRVKRITGERSVYAVKIRPNSYGFGPHRVLARVQFSADSGTPARRLPLTFRRCARALVAPRFTG